MATTGMKHTRILTEWGGWRDYEVINTSTIGIKVKEHDREYFFPWTSIMMMEYINNETNK